MDSMTGHQPFSRREQLSESRQLEHEAIDGFACLVWGILLSLTWGACIGLHAAVSAGI